MESINRKMYKFDEPLIKGVIVKRNSQFTATILLNGETLRPMSQQQIELGM